MEVTDDGIAMIVMDDPSVKMNVLNQPMVEAFEGVLQRLETDPKLKAAVLLTGKSSGWVAGADIGLLDSCQSASDFEEVAHGGQKMMDRLAALDKPVVAAIDGFCLGGGAELALACHHRIVSSSPKTKVGFPEVQLGLLPGSGGTQRLPKAVGVQQALMLMTTGSNMDAKKAKRSGFAQGVADPHALKHAALIAARDLAAGNRPKPKRPSAMQWLLERNPVGRAVLFNMFESGIKARAGTAYPAPYEVLKAVRAGLDGGHQAGQKAERQGFGRLGMTSVSKSLRSIFFASTAAKKNPYGKSGGAAADDKVVAVIGAGLMGAGIAEVCASRAGAGVLLRDKTLEGLSRGEAHIAKNLAARVKKRRMSEFEAGQVRSRVMGFSDGHAGWGRQLPRADMVIEAVFEDLGLKHRVIQELEESGLRDDAVLATNTSALPIASVAEASKHPERVVGMHYFSPAEKMPLLEIIPHEGTSEETLRRAYAMGLKQGKTVIVVKDVPGFYVNRCLGPYMAEGFALLEEGASPEELDKAMKGGFGFPVGPATLTDEVGLDVAAHVNTFLSSHLGDRMRGAADKGLIDRLVSSGMLGRKTGKGIYVYDKKPSRRGLLASLGLGGRGKGKSVNPAFSESLSKAREARGGAAKPTDQEIQDRMAGRFLIEALLCLQDGIIKTPTDGDIGAIFGIGFPPFRGGPFRHIDAVGAQKLLDQLRAFEDKHGPQFAAPQILIDHASSGKPFHSG